MNRVGFQLRRELLRAAAVAGMLSALPLVERPREQRLRAGTSVEGFSADGGARRRPVRARRAQVRQRQAPR